MQQTVTDVCRQIGGRLVHNLQVQTHEGRIYAEVNRAARIIIGVPEDETLGKDSRFNIPAVILKLSDTRLQGKIVGHVIRTLYEDGFIGDEAYVMQLKNLAADQEENNDEN